MPCACTRLAALTRHLKNALSALVLLNRDPTAVNAEAIKDIRVQMTVVHGEVVWEG